MQWVMADQIVITPEKRFCHLTIGLGRSGRYHCTLPTGEVCLVERDEQASQQEGQTVWKRVQTLVPPDEQA